MFTVISAAVIMAVPLFVILSVEVFHVMSLSIDLERPARATASVGISGGCQGVTDQSVGLDDWVFIVLWAGLPKFQDTPTCGRTKHNIEPSFSKLLRQP